MAKSKTVDRVQSIGVTMREAIIDEGGYTKFPTSIAANEKVGIEITRIQYDLLNPECLENVASAVGFSVGQIAANFAEPTPAAGANLLGYPTGCLDKAVIISAGDVQVAGDMKVYETIVHDFSNTPLLAHPAALYAQIISSNTGALAIGYCVIHFRYVDLTDAEFMDLLQGYIVQNAI